MGKHKSGACILHASYMHPLCAKNEPAIPMHLPNWGSRLGLTVCVCAHARVDVKCASGGLWCWHGEFRHRVGSLPWKPACPEPAYSNQLTDSGI